ncbi:MAG: tetratricopeptide repeat protein [Elusimicrobiota bacterium]
MRNNNWKLIFLFTFYFLLSTFYCLFANSKKEKIDFYISKGDEYLLRGEYSYAIDYYNEAKTLKEKNPKVFLRFGEAYRLADMKDEAIESYNKALKYGSNDIKIFLGLGVVYKAKYLYEQAEEFYRRALELARSGTDPSIVGEKDNIQALTGLADIFNEQGKYSEAIELYEKALFISPTDEVKLKLAMLNILVDYDGDVKQYDTALADSKILNGYIKLKKNPDDAISDFISADEYFLRAVAYLKKNDLPDAKNNFNVLIGQKEDSLSKKLSTALIKHIQ